MVTISHIAFTIYKDSSDINSRLKKLLNEKVKEVTSISL
jgi:hypothetical protein